MRPQGSTKLPHSLVDDVHVFCLSRQVYTESRKHRERYREHRDRIRRTVMAQEECPYDWSSTAAYDPTDVCRHCETGEASARAEGFAGK
ncbi:hypothetical protein D3C79_901940 [compost metagenome]